MNNDDIHMQRLARRQALGWLMAAGVATVSGSVRAQAQGAARPLCILTPAQTAGPYFVDERLNRSDIRADPTDRSIKPGVALTLELRISATDGSACAPLAGATVDIWHCDAAGVYSDAADGSFNTVGKKFLRGYQVTSADGSARFTTIYPGWYPGRAVHIHFKIRADRAAEFTSQLYFDDALTDKIHARAPYSSRGQPRLRNAGDALFRSGGTRLIPMVAPAKDGYAAIFDVGVKRT